MKARILNKALNRARAKYETAIDSLVNELENISGLELSSNDFAGDGLGITTSDNKILPTYMPIEDLLKIIERKGTFTNDDLHEYL